MREFSYRLKNGMPDEAEHVIYIYTSAGWEFKELLPANGIPQQIVFTWNQDRVPFYPPIYSPE